MRRRQSYSKDLTWAQQLAISFKLKGHKANEITDKMIKQAYTNEEMMTWFGNIVGFEIKPNLWNDIKKELNAMLTPKQLTQVQKARNKRNEREQVNRFKKTGYTLKQLINRYETEIDFTDEDVLNILNQQVDVENEPNLVFTQVWLNQHFFPYVKQKDMGSVSRTELIFRKRLFSAIGKHEYEFSNRTVLAPRELDIYFPKDNIAIEFNGDRWHSENEIMKTYNEHAYDYHKKKFDQCAEQGITLLFVWERDWKHNPDRIINAIKAVFEGKPVYKVLQKFKGAK